MLLNPCSNDSKYDTHICLCRVILANSLMLTLILRYILKPFFLERLFAWGLHSFFVVSSKFSTKLAEISDR